MKKILGLDLGTNSIGWALVEQDIEAKEGEILGMGSRIIPMTQDVLDTFSGGKPLETQTAARTQYRGIRHLRERQLLRRERLHRVLNVLDFLPSHFANQIDFEKRLGQFFDETEPKIAYDNGDFIFKTSFDEMLEEFKQHRPELFYTKPNGKETKIPYDWTIYFLRKKALTHKIEKEELAWLILHFNQKRGYYQLRGEEEDENPNKLVEFHSLKIVDVVADEKPNSKGDTWYSLNLENGWTYRRSSKTSLSDWKDKTRDFIVTTDLNDDGSIKTDKDGNEKRSFRAPSEDDWTLMKKKTEQEIAKSEKTVGTFIYDTLIENPIQKIRGKLVRTIERKYYKEELIAILKKQIELQPELFTEELYYDCVRELYKNNEAQQSILSQRDFVHLFVEDIIFYQRPLRSQKSNIDGCTLEFRPMKNEKGELLKDEHGEQVLKPLKVIPKSHPLYQEFRVWQWMTNLKIYIKEDDVDVTDQFLNTSESWEQLFEFLMTQKEVNHKDVLQYLLLPIIQEKYPNAKPAALNKELQKEITKYRWNYVFDNLKEKEEDKSKKYPCNTTGYEIRRRLEKVENVPSDFLTIEKEQQLWHIIYSVTDKNEYESALKTFARKNHLDENSFVESFRKFPPFKSEYGAYSEKAIKKLLQLMRLGKAWSWEAVDVNTKKRIDKIITGEYDETIRNRVREKAINLSENHHFQGLPIWLASYVIYDRHSEAEIAGKWNTIADMDKYLKDFKQHSLRNPIVEQVVTETLRVVKDIWKRYGNGAKNFFDEIHVELGREMKNTADDRKRITDMVSDNENTNLRIKALLMELKDNSDGKLNVEEVRPYSPMQQEALKIYEDGVLNSNLEVPDDILKISKTAQPSKTELQRYKLWLEQRYLSPYTGKIIPLSRLFTEDYQIEHIIPKSRYFDDSFNNKVICESAVNQLKDNLLGLEFIQKHYGEEVELGLGKKVNIFTEDAYKNFVKEHYAKSFAKRRNLLLDEIPEKMIARQMNDTRYISKFISGLLSNIVRADKEDDGINSKNLIPGNGKITTTLKKDWGLNDVWNDLVIPRYERMNQLTNSTKFTVWNERFQKFLPTVPLELSKNFSAKRIDHRHHAMDALVVACMTPDHVNLLNNQSAKSETSRYDLQNKLRNKEKQSWIDKKTNQRIERDIFTDFKKPWANFTVDARDNLAKTVVSFKQNLRVINKATNHYQKWVQRDGTKKKELVEQKGVNWAVRKPMHKDTVSGLIQLRKKKEVSLNLALDNIKDIVNKELKTYIVGLMALEFDKMKIVKHFKDMEYKWHEIDTSRVDIYYWEYDNVASRVSLDVSFDEKRIRETVTDTGIQEILMNHLNNYKGRKDDAGKEIPAHTLAFSAEGIEEMNKNIVQLNGGKKHQPILKVRTYEPKGNKFKVGETGNKKDKYVEAAKGTNLFFAIYQDEDGKRSYETIPLNVVIERLKQGLKAVPELNAKDDKLVEYLSPNDLVYVLTEDERLNTQPLKITQLNSEQTQRIYKMVSSTGVSCFFIKSEVATSIVNKGEYSALNKMERTIDGVMIKEHCVKLKVDSLGNISI